MTGLRNRLLWAGVALACLQTPAFAGELEPPTASVAVPAGGRSLSVEDIVNTEAFGKAAFSPDGRWAVYERRGAYSALPRFDLAQRATWAGMDLYLVDLAHPERPAERLLTDEPPGLMRGAWSPSGDRLLIYRFRDERFEIGVVRFPDRSVTWTGLTPDIPTDGRSYDWISDDRFVAMVRAADSLPMLMRYFSEGQPRAAAAWARTRLGQAPSRTVIDAEAGLANTATPVPERALMAVDLATGEQRVLLQGDVTDFELSPDRSRLAVLKGGERLPVRADAIVQADSPRRQRLVLIDLEKDRAAQPIADVDVATGLLRWSADSTAVLAWGRRDDQAWGEGGLIQASLGTYALLDMGGLTPGPDDDVLRGVRADWLGRQPVVYAAAERGGRRDWRLRLADGSWRNLTADLKTPPPRMAATAADHMLFVADEGLWRLDGDGVRRVTAERLKVSEAVPGDAEAVLRLRVNDAPRRTWAALTDPDGRSLTADASGEVRDLGGDGDADGVRTAAVSSGMSLMLIRRGLVEDLVQRGGGSTRAIDRVNAALAGVVLPTPIPIAHLDDRGREARSMLFLPADRSPEAVRGVVISVYPGLVDTGYWAGPLSLTTGLRTDVLVGAGFAVLSPPLPADRTAAERGDAYVATVDRSVDAALARYPGLPRQRVAILGHSFGGYAALEIAARSNRYRSYIVSSAPSDMFGLWGEFVPVNRIVPEDGFSMQNQQGWVEAGQGALGAPPWAEPDAYVASSPLMRADRIRSPVLLLSADHDYIPLSQSERMFSALWRLGVKTRLVTYWGEQHSVWSPANIRDRYGQVFDWLDETLGDRAVTASDPGVAPRPEPSLHRPPPSARENTDPSPSTGPA